MRIIRANDDDDTDDDVDEVDNDNDDDNDKDDEDEDDNDNNNDKDDDNDNEDDNDDDNDDDDSEDNFWIEKIMTGFKISEIRASTSRKEKSFETLETIDFELYLGFLLYIGHIKSISVKGLHSSEVADLLLTLQPQVWFPWGIPETFSEEKLLILLRFINGAG